MTEHEQARRWREGHGWTIQQLAELAGYTRVSIYFFERGMTGNGKPIDEFAWWRYRRICHSIELNSLLEHTGGQEYYYPKIDEFKWGVLP